MEDLGTLKVNANGDLVENDNIFGVPSLIVGVVKFTSINELLFSFKR